jgi:hypothetical protein
MGSATANHESKIQTEEVLPYQQFAGKQLEDGRTLSDFPIQNVSYSLSFFLFVHC